jgi:hypothetical protein
MIALMSFMTITCRLRKKGKEERIVDLSPHMQGLLFLYFEIV